MLTVDQIEAWVIKETLLGNFTMHTPADVLEVMLMALQQGYVQFDPMWRMKAQNGCVYWESLHRFYDVPWVIGFDGIFMRHFYSGTPALGVLHKWALLGMRLTGTPAVLEGYRKHA